MTTHPVGVPRGRRRRAVRWARGGEGGQGRGGVLPMTQRMYGLCLCVGGYCL